MDVDAIEQRPGDFCQVSRDNGGRAAALAGSGVVESARASLRCLSAMSA
jgi:hypothetical protein